MKKWVVFLFVAAAAAVFAQEANVAVRKIIETTGSTNYVGKAVATRSGGTPSTNAAVWSITRAITRDTADGKVTEVTTAFNTNAVGDQTTQNAWTNRVNATYK